MGLFKKIRRSFKKRIKRIVPDKILDVVKKVGPYLPGMSPIAFSRVREGINESIDKFTGKDAAHDAAREIAREETEQERLEREEKERIRDEQLAQERLAFAMSLSLRRRSGRGAGFFGTPTSAYRNIIGG